MSITPEIFTTAVARLNALFAECEARAASDIHLCAGLAPRLRVHGVLASPPGAGVMEAAEVEACGLHLVCAMLPRGEADALATARARLLADGAVDGAVSSPSGHRYRFNVFRENAATAVALRRLDDKFLSLAELGLPAQLSDFCAHSDGLVVVTGPTGSGKSTTLATLLHQINLTRQGHIITIEDPVEYVHASRQCLVNQRQIGRDAVNFYAALVESLRQDPDVILVGEIREIETIRTAITDRKSVV